MILELFQQKKLCMIRYHYRYHDWSETAEAWLDWVRGASNINQSFETASISLYESVTLQPMFCLTLFVWEGKGTTYFEDLKQEKHMEKKQRIVCYLYSIFMYDDAILKFLHSSYMVVPGTLGTFYFVFGHVKIVLFHKLWKWKQYYILVFCKYFYKNTFSNNIEAIKK